MLAALHRNPMYNLLINAYISRLPGKNGVCLARKDLIPDHDWYRSDYYQDQRAVGVDAVLVCFRAVPGWADQFSEIFLGRAVGEGDFSARDRVIVREAMAALAPLVGKSLARFADVTPATLPNRARQVLRCVLEGDGDKQIAARLGLTRNTVNQYMKQILSHFGVSSRAELLAHWVRRGWGNRFARADDTGQVQRGPGEGRLGKATRNGILLQSLS
jgi:DNA-binding CsgD family transcriptional regulator